MQDPCAIMLPRKKTGLLVVVCTFSFQTETIIYDCVSSWTAVVCAEG